MPALSGSLSPRPHSQPCAVHIPFYRCLLVNSAPAAKQEQGETRCPAFIHSTPSRARQKELRRRTVPPHSNARVRVTGLRSRARCSQSGTYGRASDLKRFKRWLATRGCRKRRRKGAAPATQRPPRPNGTSARHCFPRDNLNDAIQRPTGCDSGKIRSGKAPLQSSFMFSIPLGELVIHTPQPGARGHVTPDHARSRAHHALLEA